MKTDLDQLCEKLGLCADFHYGKAEVDGWPDAAHNWRVHVYWKRSPQRVPIQCDFFGGAAVTDPTVADVVSSLILDLSMEDPDTFDELCYDMKASEAVKLWRTIQEVAPRYRRFFGENLEALQEAEH